jgi:hypothetical protein
MEYTTKKNSRGEPEIVMFLVVATELIGGFRVPFLKTFSQDEALEKAFELENVYGPGARVKIEESMLSERYWNHKFKTPWPLKT